WPMGVHGKAAVRVAVTDWMGNDRLVGGVRGMLLGVRRESSFGDGFSMLGFGVIALRGFGLWLLQLLDADEVNEDLDGKVVTVMIFSGGRCCRLPTGVESVSACAHVVFDCVDMVTRGVHPQYGVPDVESVSVRTRVEFCRAPILFCITWTWSDASSRGLACGGSSPVRQDVESVSVLCVLLVVVSSRSPWNPFFTARSGVEGKTGRGPDVIESVCSCLCAIEPARFQFSQCAPEGAAHYDTSSCVLTECGSVGSLRVSWSLVTPCWLCLAAEAEDAPPPPQTRPGPQDVYSGFVLPLFFPWEVLGLDWIIFLVSIALWVALHYAFRLLVEVPEGCRVELSLWPDFVYPRGSDDVFCFPMSGVLSQAVV
ncbi:hypothetical protein Taro_055439, partial [Colocasia esculenta]|nr:hypothetical protein [Colocasia esculenta]